MNITGARLKELRNNSGMTQIQLSDKLGVANDTVSRWERGVLKISRESLISLAAALDTSVAYLIGETDDPTRHIFQWDKGHLQGEGKTGQNAPINSQRPQDDLAPLNPRNQTLVKVLPKHFAACCGNGVEWGDESVAYDFEYYDPDPDLTRYSPVIAMYVIGDSMEPDIEEEDIVIFTENTSDIDYAPNGSIVVANYEGRMIVRGLFRKPDHIELKAWNKGYEDIIVKAHEDLNICGVVLRVDKSKKPRPML
jgi:transcriptional regulator with XRE-family HTH domain